MRRLGYSLLTDFRLPALVDVHQAAAADVELSGAKILESERAGDRLISFRRPAPTPVPPPPTQLPYTRVSRRYSLGRDKNHATPCTYVYI